MTPTAPRQSPPPVTDTARSVQRIYLLLTHGGIPGSCGASPSHDRPRRIACRPVPSADRSGVNVSRVSPIWMTQRRRASIRGGRLFRAPYPVPGIGLTV